MKNKKIILTLTVVLVVALIAIATIETSDFDLKFAVDQNGATIEAETVTLKGKLVKLPFDLYYIKGNLNIDDKSYRLKKFNKISDRNDNLFEMVFVDNDDQEFMNGTAYLSGSIIDKNARSMYILIDKLEMKTGRSYTERINCQIEGNQKHTLEKIDESGFEIESSAYFYDGMMRVTNGKEGNEKRFGYIDNSGIVVISPVYMQTVSFSHGLAFVQYETGKGYYIDKAGKIVIEKVDGKIIGFGDLFKDGYASVYTELDGKSDTGVSIINTKSEVQLSSVITEYNYLNDGNGFFQKVSPSDYSNSTIVNSAGDVIFSNGASLVFPSKDASGFYTFDNETYGILYDNEFQEPTFQWINKFVDNRALVVDLEGSVCLIDPKGNIIKNLSSLYPTLNNINQNVFSDGVAALNFKDNKKAIIIDTDGNVVRETDLSYISAFENGVALCKKNEKYGYVDSLGNVILEPIYDFATNCSEGVGFVKQGEQWYRFE